MSAVRLAAIELPDFGTPTVEPVIPAEVYAARLATLRQRAAARGLDAILVYGDREHSAPTSPISPASIRASRRRC